MGIIQIAKLPDGEAPEEVRQAWVGLELPYVAVIQNGYSLIGVVAVTDVAAVLGIFAFKERSAVEVVSRREHSQVGKYYAVKVSQALEILERSNPMAAQWWRNLGFPVNPHDEFHFKAEAVRVIS